MEKQNNVPILKPIINHVWIKHNIEIIKNQIYTLLGNKIPTSKY